MKVLDVKSLDSGMQSIQKDIETIQAQISAIQRAVRGITELEAELKGKTGEAIRSFYQHVHQTFLIFLHQSLTDYTFILKDIKTSVSNFEGDNSGFLHEGFISEDVTNGIDRAEEMTYDLINIINKEMNSVSDIISLSPLNMDEFSHYASKGREHSTKVIEELYELDYQQTKDLEGVDKDLNLLQSYLNEMKITYGDSSAIPNFNPLSAFEMPTYKKVKEKVFGKSISIQSEDLRQLINMKYDLYTYKGIGLGIWDIVSDIAQGTYQLITDPESVVNELGYMILHPVETGKYMIEAIISSFERDVINGDNESRARWTTYAVGTVAETVLGTKGVFAGLRISRTGSKISNIKSKDVNNTGQSNIFYYPTNDLAFAGVYDTVPYNVYNLNKIKEQLTKGSTNLNFKMDGKGTSKNIKNYRKTFFDEYPELEGSVVVHHAIEQQVLKKYPNLFTLDEIHALENLRGIPKKINSDIHLSKLRKDWNRFYRNHPNPTKEEIINYMIELDKKYGENFNPPIKN
ncbi:LXG domain-containing protein [Pseudogracilibacillus sp. SO30301A]|uniref:LXG domain-containing protein n=1 Tax=Pseudogracilibacillus sp. SO30301A TaxID=3098291 RepID=UPI00300E348B